MVGSPDKKTQPTSPEFGELLTNPRQKIVVALSSKGDWADWVLFPKGMLTRDLRTMETAFSNRVDEYLAADKQNVKKGEETAIVHFVQGSSWEDLVEMEESMWEGNLMEVEIPKLIQKQILHALSGMKVKPRFRPQLILSVGWGAHKEEYRFPRYRSS